MTATESLGSFLMICLTTVDLPHPDPPAIPMISMLDDLDYRVNLVKFEYWNDGIMGFVPCGQKLYLEISIVKSGNVVNISIFKSLQLVAPGAFL